MTTEIDCQSANNLPEISTEALQQLVNKWQDSCYKFCIEQDLTDSDDSQYYLNEEAKMMYSD